AHPLAPSRHGINSGDGSVAPLAFLKRRAGRVLRVCDVVYVMYCRAQAAECARRVKLASSPEVAASHRSLGLRWLRLAGEAAAAPFGRTSKSAALAARP